MSKWEEDEKFMNSFASCSSRGRNFGSGVMGIFVIFVLESIWSAHVSRLFMVFHIKGLTIV